MSSLKKIIKPNEPSSLLYSQIESSTLPVLCSPYNRNALSLLSPTFNPLAVAYEGLFTDKT